MLEIHSVRKIRSCWGETHIKNKIGSFEFQPDFEICSKIVLEFLRSAAVRQSKCVKYSHGLQTRLL